jgi:hypothetical protein
MISTVEKPPLRRLFVAHLHDELCNGSRPQANSTCALAAQWQLANPVNAEKVMPLPAAGPRIR